MHNEGTRAIGNELPSRKGQRQGNKENGEELRLHKVHEQIYSDYVVWVFCI